MDELLDDGKNTDNVLTLSMGFDRKSYSPLDQINKNNVKRLVPVWSTSLMNDMASWPRPWSTTASSTQSTASERSRSTSTPASRFGARRCSSSPHPRANAALNRGAPTIYNGKLFRVTNDNYLVALDEDTGRTLWQFKTSSSVNATAITYTHKGKQYLSIASGMGGTLARRFAGGKVPTGGSLWTFALMPE